MRKEEEEGSMMNPRNMIKRIYWKKKEIWAVKNDVCLEEEADREEVRTDIRRRREEGREVGKKLKGSVRVKTRKVLKEKEE